MGLIFLTLPSSKQVTCTGDALGSEQLASSQQGLKYDPFDGQYSFLWQTDKAWKGTCREFILAFDDGSYQQARFSFK
ncbi:MAG: PxKF domain-containing protein [Deinococcales bacterium]